MRNLTDTDTDKHPRISHGKLGREWKTSRSTHPPCRVSRRQDYDGVERERCNDVCQKRDEGNRPPPQPAQAQQGLPLARTAPAQLLLPERPPIGRRISRDARGGLIDGAPTVAEQLVRQYAVVADVERHPEDGLSHELLDSGLECDTPVGNRPPR